MSTQVAISPVNKLKQILNAESVQEQIKNAMQENSGAFVASLIDLYASDTYLQKCNPSLVVMEALKAATLKLPINKQLGFAYIVPYKRGGAPIPQFQIGYKGYIQLAMRTGQYRFLNAGAVYEGCKVERNILTGEIKIAGEPTSEKPIGYFAYLELLNGFSKTVYMTHDEVHAHAQKYSKSYNEPKGTWKTNPETMSIKTVLRLLLSKYAILSTEMITALTSDHGDDVERAVDAEIEANANGEVIDVEAEPEEEDGEEPGDDWPDPEPAPQEAKGEGQGRLAGPGF